MHDQLYVTRDEGASWQTVGPALDGESLYAAGFLGDGAGWLVAGRSSASSDRSLTLARTSDFGAHWESSSFSLTSADESAPAVASFQLTLQSFNQGTLQVRYASSSNFERWAEYRTLDGGNTWSEIARVDQAGEGARDDGVVYLAGHIYGWRLRRSGNCTSSDGSKSCAQSWALEATRDGGRTWRNLPMPAGLDGVRQWTVAASEASTGGAASIASRTMIAVGQGFDKCELATSQELSAWRASSPYTAVNLYIGGTLRACPNALLSADYLRSLYAMGWTFIPTWVGPQAPCSNFRNPRISWDLATARSQGWADANAAADKLAWLALAEPSGSGSIAYYDMEYYDTRNGSCNAAVQAFIGGWNEGLHARGSLAGVYGTGSTLRVLAGLAQPPDAIWPAHWIYDDYAPGASVWDVYALSNDVWSDRQRLRQYTGGHEEGWGGVRLNVDSNALEGPVALMAPAPSTPTPTATVTPTPTATRLPFTPSAWVYLPLIREH